MHEQIRELEELSDEIDIILKSIDLDGLKIKLAKLESEMSSEDFWQDTNKAAGVSQRQTILSKRIKAWEDLRKQVRETKELASLDDHSLEKELIDQVTELRRVFEKMEIEAKLSGKYDSFDTILHIHAGTGGTDAMDWAQMLERMYLRWAERAGYKSELISESAGEEAGLKSALIKLSGEYAYGKLKGEHGVHRLVRLSPFNSDNLRQTSFALVEVLPDIGETDEVNIDPRDLRVDVFRSSGKGGQSVNTTDSAVRITHLPTNITVSIQNERSQIQNREAAMKVLRARLAQIQNERREKEISEIKGDVISADWGSQIRNYVLHPYTLVKDTRTHHETTKAEAVLDGDIDQFIDRYLASLVKNNK